VNADLMFGGVMFQRAIECLSCGTRRLVSGEGSSATGACAQCGYLGWTYADEQGVSHAAPDRSNGPYAIVRTNSVEAYLDQ
jgi:hypothetical protein